MTEQQQRQINEAAEKFAEAIKGSYQALADRSVSAQELNAQLTQNFFNGVINNLRTQAGSNRALTENLIEQQQKQQEASQALTQESVNAYMDLLNSMFSYYRGNLDQAQNAQAIVTKGFPIAGYDEMNVDEITGRLGDLTVEQLQKVKHYEKRNKNRSTLVEAIDFRLTGNA
jgi:hypothetical protein